LSVFALVFYFITWMSFIRRDEAIWDINMKWKGTVPLDLDYKYLIVTVTTKKLLLVHIHIRRHYGGYNVIEMILITINIII
jgi:hypothetical protein